MSCFPYYGFSREIIPIDFANEARKRMRGFKELARSGVFVFMPWECAFISALPSLSINRRNIPGERSARKTRLPEFARQLKKALNGLFPVL